MALTLIHYRQQTLFYSAIYVNAPRFQRARECGVIREPQLNCAVLAAIFTINTYTKSAGRREWVKAERTCSLVYSFYSLTAELAWWECTEAILLHQLHVDNDAYICVLNKIKTIACMSQPAHMVENLWMCYEAAFAWCQRLQVTRAMWNIYKQCHTFIIRLDALVWCLCHRLCQIECRKCMY